MWQAVEELLLLWRNTNQRHIPGRRRRILLMQFLFTKQISISTLRAPGPKRVLLRPPSSLCMWEFVYEWQNNCETSRVDVCVGQRKSPPNPFGHSQHVEIFILPITVANTRARSKKITSHGLFCGGHHNPFLRTTIL